MKKPRFWPVDCLAFRQLQALALRVRWSRQERIAQQTAGQGLSPLQRSPRLALMAVGCIMGLSACDQLEQGQRILEGVQKAFTNPAMTTLVWDEQVKLHDGRVILIKRREASGGGGFPVSGMNASGITQYYEFCYPEMGVYWKSKGSPRYQPEILDILDGKAYVKVPISGTELCMFHDYPATNAIYFVWEGGSWKKIPYEEFPQEIRRTNLLLNAWGRHPANYVRGRLTVEMKEGRDSIYGAMRRTNGRIQSLTDYPDMHGECESHIGSNIQTTRTPEVFLPPTPDLCQLPQQGGL